MRLVKHVLLAVTVAGLNCAGLFAQHGAGHMEAHEHIAAHAGHWAHAPLPATVRLANHPAFTTALSTRLAPLLPAGTTIQADAAGFRTLGQFVAAVHAANNLNIPFAQLQAKMTGPNAETLGQAIQSLEPNLTPQTVRSDVKQAKRQARQDVASSVDAVEEVDDVH
jgi:hypothetical protein